MNINILSTNIPSDFQTFLLDFNAVKITFGDLLFRLTVPCGISGGSWPKFRCERIIFHLFCHSSKQNSTQCLVFVNLVFVGNSVDDFSNEFWLFRWFTDDFSDNSSDDFSDYFSGDFSYDFSDDVFVSIFLMIFYFFYWRFLRWIFWLADQSHYQFRIWISD